MKKLIKNQRTSSIEVCKPICLCACRILPNGDDFVENRSMLYETEIDPLP
ncbi:hypothetical protein PV797_05260 [Clostridiaceae bacterium M8S5]|nr:hypothetical protein PV797_05260 [Clostridiaceae bacterium M8S5]